MVRLTRLLARTEPSQPLADRLIAATSALKTPSESATAETD